MTYEDGYREALAEAIEELNDRIGQLANLELAWLARYELRKMRDELEGMAAQEIKEPTQGREGYGDNVPGDPNVTVGLSLPKSLVSKIEARRGSMKRSPFIKGLLITALGGER